MTKANEDKKDVYKALLAQRNTVQEGFSTSPAQRFLGRRAKTDLPTTKSLLQPNTNHLSDKINRQQKLKAYDKHTKELLPLKEQHNARLKPVSLGDTVWAKAKVIKRLDERSYLVDNGKSLLRRNRVDFRKTPDTKQSISIDNDVKDVETRSTILQSYKGSQTVHDSGSKTTHDKSSDQKIPPSPPCDPLPSSPGPADGTEAKPVITRSGRRSVKPKFLQDYV